MSVVGKTIEGITLKATSGLEVTFPDICKKGKTVIYFYPKDDTPGCTIQACSYRDNIESFKNAGVQVIGVSSDDMESHDAFTAKFNLNFPLIVDSEQVLRNSLGATGRDSFLLDETGTVINEWKSVSPSETVKETLDAALS